MPALERWRGVGCQISRGQAGIAMPLCYGLPPIYLGIASGAEGRVFGDFAGWAERRAEIASGGQEVGFERREAEGAGVIGDLAGHTGEEAGEAGGVAEERVERGGERNEFVEVEGEGLVLFAVG